jgi:Endonuclease-reverse transcriptase
MAGLFAELFRLQNGASSSSTLMALLVLMSGVELNPGPAFMLRVLNAQSIVHKGPLILLFIDSHRLDALAISESKIAADDPDAVKLDPAPSGFAMLHLPRLTATSRNRGGGLCFIYWDTIRVKSHSLQSTLRHTTFKCQQKVNVGGSGPTDGVIIAVIYRPTSSNLPTFQNDLSDLLDKVGDVVDADRFIACGDVNCGGVDYTSVSDELLALLEAHGLRQFVPTATRSSSTVSNLLDVVANASSGRIAKVIVIRSTLYPIMTSSCDHRPAELSRCVGS